MPITVTSSSTARTKHAGSETKPTKNDAAVRREEVTATRTSRPGNSSANSQPTSSEVSQPTTMNPVIIDSAGAPHVNGRKPIETVCPPTFEPSDWSRRPPTLTASPSIEAPGSTRTEP